MGCCQKFILNPEEIVSLQYEVEKEKIRSMKLNKYNQVSNENININDSTNKEVGQIGTFKKENTFFESDDENSINNEINKSLFNEINTLRLNPSKYIEKIKKYENLVEYNNNEGYYLMISNYKFLLNQGKGCFQESIKFLQDKESLNPLVFSDDLSIKIPKYIESDNNKYISNTIENLKVSLKNRFLDISYLVDKNIANTEFAVVFNIVNNNQNRDLLLNETYNSIFITSKKIDESYNAYCYFIILGYQNYEDDEF